ncbi:hypothetical protein ARAM_005927 [Aspergillus rambellii]|uniref:AAA+ ATPase domain-containing protein n=1 Tax=Aspergillus rambellii TaxID=308745 RepID=A0A0F8VLM7_9EURO|nr:hypothetical protein ARAM_005927 [Aspergillus rambellii]
MRPKSRNDFTIAIICALPLEADAVEAFFDETYDRLGRYYSKQPGDRNAYINGRIGRHHVVLCYLPGMGKGSAASVASSLRVSYTGVHLALLVGICGGVPSISNDQKIFLGDVIISDAVIEYDFGRQYSGGFQRKTGVKETLARPDQEIRSLLNGLRADKTSREIESQILEYLHVIQQGDKKWNHPQIDDILFRACHLHKHYNHSIECCCLQSDSFDSICENALKENCNDLGCDNEEIIRCRKPSENARVSAYIGTVASADTVMKSGQHRDSISQKEGVIGFETVGAGVWDNIPCIIIKGVCDYADSHKNNLWQAYAAATGAAAAKAFLEYWRPSGQEEDASNKCHSMIPFERNPRFVGRQEEIRMLEDLISRSNGPKKLAITGLGGTGKTQVVLELAYRMQDRDSDCSIFWIPCTSHKAIEQACMTITQMIGIQDAKPAEVKEHIKDYFSQKDRKWLLIFDNVDDMDMWTKCSSTSPPLKDFFPHNNQGHIIFTTRNRKLAVKLASSVVIHVPELDEKTGIELLNKLLIQKDLLDNIHPAINLLEQLTFLPLAIAQAAAYINENGIGVSEYLLLLQEPEADVIELLSEKFCDDGRYNDMQNPVAITWLISFHQVQKLDQLASDYLSLMACINPRNIPQSFLPPAASRKKMVDALGLLNAYSFITIQPENGFITLHRLVRLATRNWMIKEGRFPLYITKAADRMNKIFPHGTHGNRQLWRECLPHALSFSEENEFKKRQERYINCIWKMASCFDRGGRYNEAEELLVRVIKTWKQVLGPEHPNTVTGTGSLALTYQSRGRWKEAEELFPQAIETQKPDTLTSMANLACTRKPQGKDEEALELMMESCSVAV